MLPSLLISWLPLLVKASANTEDLPHRFKVKQRPPDDIDFIITGLSIVVSCNDTHKDDRPQT